MAHYFTTFKWNPFFPTKIEINYISLHDIALDISLSKRGVSYIYEYHIGEWVWIKHTFFFSFKRLGAGERGHWRFFGFKILFPLMFPIKSPMLLQMYLPRSFILPHVICQMFLMLFPYVPHMCSFIVSHVYVLTNVALVVFIVWICPSYCYQELLWLSHVLCPKPYSFSLHITIQKAKCNLYVSNVCLPLCFNFILYTTCNFYHVSH